MSEMQTMDRTRADQVFAKRELFRLQLYLLNHGFERFTAYYLPEKNAENTTEAQAECLLPAEILLEDAERYETRDLRLATVPIGKGGASDSDGPFVLIDGEPGVMLKTPGDDPTIYAAASLDRLLRAGEERIFFNDREGRVGSEDFRTLADSSGIDPAQIISALIAERFVGADGVVTTRQRRAVESLSPTSLPTTELLQQFFTQPHSVNPDETENSNPIQESFQRKLRSDNAIADRYGRPRGLFNFDRAGLNYTAYLGRGEHNVFFEYLIGNRYGNFMPYSFTDAAASPELSIEIYRELVERTILDSRGRLPDIRRLDRLACVSDSRDLNIQPEIILEGVREILRDARALGLEAMRNDLKYDRDGIENDLQDSELGFDAVRRFVNDPGHVDHARFMAAYQESRIHQEINFEAAKNRGIILGETNKPASLLLLITDSVLISAPYYAFLLDSFRERFAADTQIGAKSGTPEIRIAHAYHAPTPRNPRKFPHPIVHALQMMERETTPDLRTTTDFHHEPDSSS